MNSMPLTITKCMATFLLILCSTCFLQVGMYAVGLSDEEPFTFATAIPHLKFHWSITNNEVALLKSVYDSVRISTVFITFNLI